jgi:hypothetical protein
MFDMFVVFFLKLIKTVENDFPIFPQLVICFFFNSLNKNFTHENFYFSLF